MYSNQNINFSMSEPNAGSDVVSMKTKAVKYGK